MRLTKAVLATRLVEAEGNQEYLKHTRDKNRM